MRFHAFRFALAGFAAVAVTACSDDNGSSADTIDDTSGDVDPDTKDTTDTADTVDTTDTNDTAQPDADDTTEPDTTDTTAPDTTDTSVPDTTPLLAVVINEVAATGDPNDWIELYNAGASTVDLTGWLVRDDDATHAFVFGANTTLAAGAYLVIERDPTNGGFDFGLGTADAVLLYDASSTLVDSTSWLTGQSPAGAAWGRFPNGSGNFKTLLGPTRGAANVDNPASTCGDGTPEGLEICDTNDFLGLSCATYGWGGGTLECLTNCSQIGQSKCTARAAGLVINEVESDDTDRIELYNGTAVTLDLAGYSVLDDSANAFVLPAGKTIAAGGYLVLERDIDHTFGLGDADSVELLDKSGARVDFIAWIRGQAIPSYCRTPNATGGFRTCDEQTFGNPNL